MRRGKENVNRNKKQKKGLIVGTTGAVGTIALNYFFKFVTIETIFIIIFFILLLLFLLQDFIFKCLNRICMCIERIAKFREETKRTTVGGNDGSDGDGDKDVDCKPYVIKRRRSS